MRQQPYCHQGVFTVLDGDGEVVASISNSVYIDQRVGRGGGYPDIVRIEDGVVLLCSTGVRPVGLSMAYR